MKCQIPQIYIPRTYKLDQILPFLQKYNLGGGTGISLSTAQMHAGTIALFAAVIAPFGGFFASGLKRALKLKDFAESIPGHGGFADRFDCHFVISFITYFYLTQFVYKSEYTLERLFDYLERLNEPQKLRVLEQVAEMVTG